VNIQILSFLNYNTSKIYSLSKDKGTNRPRNETSTERNVRGMNRPGNETSKISVSFLGTKCLGNEKSSHPKINVTKLKHTLVKITDLPASHNPTRSTACLLADRRLKNKNAKQ